MADYLTRLAQRTLGVAPIARPDVAVVAASFGAATPSDAGEPLSGDATPPARVGGDAAGHAGSISPTAGRAPNREDSIGPVTIKSARAASDASDANRGRRRAAEVPSSASFDRHEVPAMPVSVQRRVEAAKRNGASVVAVPLPASTPPVSGDRDAAHMRAGLDRGVGQPHVPTINIHIGRIEVRAATRPTQAPPHQARPRQLQSLDSYLRQRNGERR